MKYYLLLLNADERKKTAKKNKSTATIPFKPKLVRIFLAPSTRVIFNVKRILFKGNQSSPDLLSKIQ